MLIGNYFKEKRIEKGLSESELSALISPNFQESLLWDFESGDDNDIDGWSIREFKRYCDVLEVKPSDYADVAVSDLVDLPLANLIRTRRKEMGYSIGDLSDLIGFEENVIHSIENEQDDIVVALNAIKQLSLILCIPFRLLLEKI